MKNRRELLTVPGCVMPEPPSWLDSNDEAEGKEGSDAPKE